LNESVIRLRFTGAASDVQLLQGMLAREGQETSSLRRVEEPGQLALNLEDVSALVAVMQGLFFAGPLVPHLLSLFKRKNDGHESRLIVEGPTKRIEIVWDEGVTEEELRRVLKQVAEV